MNNIFAIGIPTINRFDLLKPSLLILSLEYPDTRIYVVDNGNQGIKEDPDFKFKDNIIVFEPKKNLGVAASWNYLCKEIYKEHKHALLLNDDIIIGMNEGFLKNMVNQLNDEDMYYTATDYSVILLSNKVFNEVGGFDELFYPAYYEDNDFEYRAELLGIKRVELPSLKPVLYRNTSSIIKMEYMSESVWINKQYYINKWGGTPSEEKFKKPFNI
jgi:GT2 family glycosyltransferase